MRIKVEFRGPYRLNKIPEYSRDFYSKPIMGMTPPKFVNIQRCTTMFYIIAKDGQKLSIIIIVDTNANNKINNARLVFRVVSFVWNLIKKYFHVLDVPAGTIGRLCVFEDIAVLNLSYRLP